MIMTSKTEIWKSHPDIVGIEVSTLGRVRTLDRVTSSEKRTRFQKGRILKQSYNANGYLKVNIPINGKQATKRVNRLVAQTFIQNTDDLPQVNHKDCIRTNNNVENLEWCDNSYNVQYREKYGKTQSKPLLAINLSTLEVLHFSSQGEASRELGVSVVSVNNVIKGRQKTANGYWFVNADENVEDIINHKLHEIKGEA